MALDGTNRIGCMGVSPRRGSPSVMPSCATTPTVYLLLGTSRLALLRFAVRRLGHSPHTTRCGDGTAMMLDFRVSANATNSVALDHLRMW